MLEENPVVYRLLVGLACVAMVGAGIVVGATTGGDTTEAEVDPSVTSETSTSIQTPEPTVATAPATPASSDQPTTTSTTVTLTTQTSPSTESSTTATDATTTSEPEPSTQQAVSSTSTTATSEGDTGLDCAGRVRDVQENFTLYRPDGTDVSRLLVVIGAEDDDQRIAGPDVCGRDDPAKTAIIIVESVPPEGLVAEAIAHALGDQTEADVHVVAYGDASAWAFQAACALEDGMVPGLVSVLAIDPTDPPPSCVPESIQVNVRDGG